MSMKCQQIDNISAKTSPIFHFPYHIRCTVIEEMDTLTKLSYFLSSDLASMDMPKNYITSIQFYDSSVKIRTTDDRFIYSTLMFSQNGYECDFCVESDDKILRWVEIGSDAVANVFQRLLRKSESLKTLIVEMKAFPFQHTAIANMKDMRYVTLNLEQHGLMDCGFVHFEQLYHVQDVLNITFIKLGLNQLVQFNAEYVTFGRTIISTDALNQYFQHFVDGNIQEGIQELVMHIDSTSYLKVDRVCEGLNTLGMVNEDSMTTFVLISKATSPRIAFVKYSQKFVKVEFYSAKECQERSYLPPKYKDLVKNYLQIR